MEALSRAASMASTSVVLNECMYRFDQLPGASASAIADAAASDIRYRTNTVNYLFFGVAGLTGAVVLVVGALALAQAAPVWLAPFGMTVDRDAILAPISAGAAPCRTVRGAGRFLSQTDDWRQAAGLP